MSATVTSLAESALGRSTQSPVMKQLNRLVQRLSSVDSTVLITGERGTGKERIARSLHDRSARRAKPFIAINCGALTETLLESELFGLFEAAEGGSLLLDEVGEVSLGMQVKLLHVLQGREVRLVGQNRSRPVDVRLLAATNRNLAHAVAEGTFRQDLYHRLKVVELEVPPLRERREDVLPLARLLLGVAATRISRPTTGFSAGVAEVLLRHDWPGNVRELESAMEHAVALARGTEIELEHLPAEVRGPPAPPPPCAPGQGRPLAYRKLMSSGVHRRGGLVGAASHRASANEPTLARVG